MKFQFLFLALFLSGIPGTENIRFSSDDKKESIGEWEVVQDSEGVQTSVRWIETGKGIKTRERKGEMFINCSVDDVTGILTDAKSSACWMRNVEESFDLERVNQSEWYTYTVFNIPWPFENRDLVSYMTMKTNSENRNTNISIVSMEDYIPCKSRITRLTDYMANWSIVRINYSRIRITFTAISGSPPTVPRWIQDPVVENIFHGNLINLKAYILSNKKSNS
ncbi:MAG TPA: hypothetical protein VJ346_03560 [Bacteroidales bacterium]|nr:hypothetical protein [Bacteroidales bacterium]